MKNKYNRITAVCLLFIFTFIASSCTDKDNVEEKTSVLSENTSCSVESVLPEEYSPENREITFPYTVPDTGLVIESVNTYDGVFLEDGSDTPISGVAAISVKNTGKQCIDYAEITMVGSKTNYRFKISGLAAGASLVVHETGKAPSVSQKYESITALPSYTENFEMSEDIIEVEETSDGQLQVTNLTDKKIPCVRVFYKFYSEERSTYVGGITYTAKITDLEPHALIQVRPSHYKTGESRIIMVRTFETEEG